MEEDNNQEIAKMILKELEDDYKPTSLETYEQHQQRLLLQIQCEVENVGKDFVTGIKMLLEKLSTMEFEEKEKEEIPSIEAILNALREPSEEMQERIDKDGESLTGQEIAGLSDGAMANLFHAAWGLVNEETSYSAPKAFGALVTLNPNVGLFWRGLGESLEEAKKLDEALSCFIMAMQVDPYEIKGYFRAAVIAKFQDKQEIVDEILNLAREWLKEGDDEEAITALTDDVEKLEGFLSFMK